MHVAAATLTLALAAAIPQLRGLHRDSASADAEGAAVRILSARVAAPHGMALRFSGPVNLSPDNFRVAPRRAPDIALPVLAVEPGPGHRVVLKLDGELASRESYRVSLRDPPLEREVSPSTWALLVSVLLASALINNFVFTRYLGLCIFFGVSKKRDTSIGMGLTFTAVMVFTAFASWAIFRFAMQPLQLGFLQVLVFIGVVAFVVQFLDTMLRKTHPALHKRFGIYLVLITTNCIILAVPLLNAAADSGALESLALALGSGLGFALALFLMSCARERAELARVPAPFQGLPIAFALAGLFALAFMGFSGLDFFR
jgi:electron transport complex protein RnfA